MTTTEQDARALAYLAARLREDTHGANRWDTPGIWAEVSQLVGQDLAISIERVSRHAADPKAKTPGAIRRPYTPPAPEQRRDLDTAPVHTRCVVCGRRRGECNVDHEFRSWQPNAADISPVIGELRDKLHPSSVPGVAEGSRP